MSLNDPLSNALSKILNAENRGKNECTINPASKVIKKILELMQEHHYIGENTLISKAKGGVINVNFIGRINKCGAIKPRFPVSLGNFEKFEKRYLPAKGFGVMFISTNKGILTHTEAKKKKLGGKLISYVY